MGDKDKKDTVSAVDKKLAEAKQKKELRKKTEGTETAKVAGGAVEGGTTPTKEKKELTDEQKAEIEKKLADKKLAEETKAKEKEAEKAKKAEASAAKKAKRLADKAEKDKAKAERKPHMKKLENAKSKLPALNEDTQSVFDDITKNKGIDIGNLAIHLAFHGRITATTAALGVKLTEGQEVRITGGDSRYVGKVGVMAKVQRIRGYVTVPGVDKDVYLFLSDVTPVTAEQVAGDEASSEEETAAAA